jgi:phage/plasmid primase-like uncharacterized protein
MTGLTNIADIKAAAYGRWGNEIIPHFGIDKSFLSGKHYPCPIHGGKDGFRFTDEDHGWCICATCTNSKFIDGFSLIAKYKGISNREAFHMVAQYLREHQPLTQNQKMLTKKKTLPPILTPVQQQKLAATYCMEILSQCIWGVHPYLTGKNLDLPALINTKPYKVPYSKQIVRKDALIIPLYDLATDDLISLQFINADGSRGFIANTNITNAVHVVLGSSSLCLSWIGVVEGYADALTVSFLTDATVVMACNSGGITNKAKQIQALYPDKKLVFFADNDELKTGQKAAISAQKLTGGYIITPPNVGDDWNDHFKIYGLGNFQYSCRVKQNRFALLNT